MSKYAQTSEYAQTSKYTHPFMGDESKVVLVSDVVVTVTLVIGFLVAIASAIWG